MCWCYSDQQNHRKWYISTTYLVSASKRAVRSTRVGGLQPASFNSTFTITPYWRSRLLVEELNNGERARKENNRQSKEHMLLRLWLIVLQQLYHDLMELNDFFFFGAPLGDFRNCWSANKRLHKRTVVRYSQKSLVRALRVQAEWPEHLPASILGKVREVTWCVVIAGMTALMGIA